jgi:glutathione S-transferase kappa 1
MVLHSTVGIGRGLMTRARIDLFFDCISPYTHISLHLWSRYAKAWPVTLKLRPFFLGGVMQATGNQPPGMLAPRGAFLEQDLRRSAALYEVPLLALPTNFFTPPLQKSAMGVARLMCAAQLEGVGDSKLLDLAVAASDCMHSNSSFRSNAKLTIDDALLHAACSDAGLEVGSLLEQAQGEGAKKALRANTDEAVRRGAFGSPTAFVFSAEGAGRNESEGIFFGSDRMEQLAHHLSLPYGGAHPPRDHQGGTV